MSWGNIFINFTSRYVLILYNLDLQLLVGDNSTKNGALWNNDKLSYNCLKMRCSGKMAPPYENRVNPHSQHRQNFSSGPGTSNFWTVVAGRELRCNQSYALCVFFRYQIYQDKPDPCINHGLIQPETDEVKLKCAAWGDWNPSKVPLCIPKVRAKVEKQGKKVCKTTAVQC